MRYEGLTASRSAVFQRAGKSRQTFVLKKEIAFWVLFFCGIISAQSLNLSDAIQKAESNHPSLEQLTAYQASQIEHSAGIKTAYMPVIAFDGSIAHADPVPKFGQYQMAPDVMISTKINADMTVADFGKRRAMIAANDAISKVTSDKISATKTAIDWQTTQLYYAILLSDRTIAVADSQITTLNVHRQSVQKKINGGTATSYDLTVTDCRIAEAKSRRADLCADRARREIALKTLINDSTETALVLEGTFDEVAAPVSVDSLIADAKTRRSDLAVAKKYAAACKANTVLTSYETLPTVGVHLDMGGKNGEMPNIGDYVFVWTAAAKVHVPIWDGNARRSHAAEAKFVETIAADSIKTVERKISTEVRTAAADLNAALEKEKLVKIQKVQAEEARKQAKDRFKGGVVTTLELLDAEQRCTDADLMVLQARYVSTMARFSLNQALGKNPV